MTPTLRTARPDDAAILQDIERRAGARFRDVGMPEVADDAPASEAELTEYALDGRSWVIADRRDLPIGYVLVDVIDGCAHIEQVTVAPDHQGAGLGRALIAHVAAWAIDQDLAAVTLTTFREVPWNAPLYRHLGFRDLGEAEIGPELRALRDEETAQGLDPRMRICMRAEVASSGAGSA